MAGETPVTICGTLGAEPDIRFTKEGKEVANLRIATTPRRFDKASGDWVDGETLWISGTLWGQAAANAVESFTKGTRVIAVGNLVQRSFTDRDGNQRTSVELDITDIGPSVKFKAATVHEPNQALNQVREQVASKQDTWDQAPPF